VTRFTLRFAFAALILASASSAARAASWMPNGVGNDFYAPRVPVSAFARPASWFDPSRMHLSTSVTVGSGFGGTQALQTTSLGYRFRAPLWFNVSVGNAWGLQAARGNSSLFLQGVDIGYQPFSSMLIQVHYQDLRSPLQTSPTRLFDSW